MKFQKLLLCVMFTLIGAALLTGCGSGGDEEQMPKIDMTQWQYNEEHDVYWQTGISYCAAPADENYETLGIYVPGAYMTGTENDDGTYTCQVNEEGSAGGFTGETAADGAARWIRRATRLWSAPCGVRRNDLCLYRRGLCLHLCRMPRTGSGRSGRE